MGFLLAFLLFMSEVGEEINSDSEIVGTLKYTLLVFP
jgi:hypothetical protein